MNAPRKSAPHQSHERTPTSPQQDSDRKPSDQSKPHKPHRHDKRDGDRHVPNEK